MYLTADFKDRNRDDYDNLFNFEHAPFHVDSGYQWVWFAPQGCSIQAINRDGESENIVGIKTLTGATTPQVDADLKLVMNDAGTGNMLHNIDKISFGSDCGDYYNAPVNLFWDLDRNGIFEAQGNTANFSAALVTQSTPPFREFSRACPWGLLQASRIRELWITRPRRSPGVMERLSQTPYSALSTKPSAMGQEV